ncbi:hypothetical protein [Lysinibacillus sp. NPDC059133]|uniref:hypothetical protein n=1 Tax=Lysinibacillus sp. NPDC059133 TaxID=3346737 RepID=UPI0036B24B17
MNQLILLRCSANNDIAFSKANANKFTFVWKKSIEKISWYLDREIEPTIQRAV